MFPLPQFFPDPRYSADFIFSLSLKQAETKNYEKQHTSTKPTKTENKNQNEQTEDQ